MLTTTRRLGREGPVLPAIGLGCMGMSDAYGPADETESLATIEAALDAGVSVLDTGDFYGSGHNEMLVGRALRGGRRDRAFVQVKFGALRNPAGGFVGIDARPAAVKNFLAMTLRRLGTDHVDLYQPARVDPAVPIEDTVGAIADLVRAGYVRHIGLSEAGPDTIRRAHATHPIAALQIDYSLMSRGIEAAILPTCRELGVGVTAYGVLGRGLLGGSAPAGTSDFRAHSPRFQGENGERNRALAEALRRVAEARGATPAQLAIAWALSRGEDVLPLVGARRRDRLAEALGAADLVLSPEEIAAIEAAVPAAAVAGSRYDPGQMALLDSERAPAA
ncbi:MAG: Oxidoreductase, aldo/keto reductase family [uncultured Acetobacteraceae bacterium]|uniref:Oxidoreductase, aldo/keto reductase family n=1 Tax=uncultured Acetobacteraceae bacterium TaxID=169975 RepID=A0A6J4ILZ4_9PROT|nr:MAG: Oxidoreductase, aldo/keto reductase family [uncultured Acetobacteraceae bacterium]